MGPKFLSSYKAGRARGCVQPVLGASTLFRMDAEGGQFCCWRPFPSVGLLCPGLLLILNDKLVSRIQLANMDLPADYFKVSFGFIHQGLNFYRILYILIFSEGISYPPDSIHSVIVGAEMLALSQHRPVQI